MITYNFRNIILNVLTGAEKIKFSKPILNDRK